MAYTRDDLPNTWDPMAESYYDENINSYEHGPGVNLTPYARTPANSEFKLYVNRIPDELTEEGLKQIFDKFGETSGVMSPPGATWGFVTYNSFREAELAIRELNGKKPLCLAVMFAKQKENKANNLSTRPLPAGVMPNVVPVPRPPPILEDQHRNYIRPMVQNLGRGKELAALARRAAGPSLSGRAYHETDDLLYSAINDPNFYDPYEDPEPFPETNNMWARGKLQVSNDGTRFVTMGRGYTWYELPTQHPRVNQQVRAVYENRTRGLYKYGENTLAQHVGKCQYCSQSATMRCQRCKEFYCSRICQENDWCRHKIECQVMPDLEGAVDSGSISNSSGEEVPQQVPKKLSIKKLRRPLTTPSPLRALHSASTPISSTSLMPEMPVQIPAGIPKLEEKGNEPLILQDNFKRNHSGNQKPVFDQNNTSNTGYWNPMKNGDDQLSQSRDGQGKGSNISQRLNPANSLPLPLLNQNNGAQQMPSRKDLSQGSFDNNHERRNQYGNEQQQQQQQQNRNFFNRENAQQRNYQQVNDKLKELNMNDAEAEKPVRKPLLPEPDVSFHKASEMREFSHSKSPTKVSFQEPKDQTMAGTSGIKPPLRAVANDMGKKMLAPIKAQISPAAALQPSAAKKKIKNIIDLLEVNEEGCCEAHVLLGGNKAAVTVCVLKCQAEYAKISSKLTPECENMKKSAQFAPNVGDFVCGKRLDDWIRGTVTAVGPPKRLAAVDEGRVESVTDVKPIPPGFEDLPTLGAICTLTKGDFQLEPMAQYTFLVTNKYDTTGQNRVEIVLFSPDEQEGRGFLEPWTPAPEQRGIPYATLTSGTEVCITSYRSHALLFVRSLVPKDIETFNKILQEVARWSTQATKFTVPPVEGEIVIAKYAEDGNWYRAIIRKIADTKIIVSYVDFGNVETTTVDNLRPISQKLKEYPSCAARAMLKDVPKDVPMTKEVNGYLGILTGTEKPLLCTFDGSPVIDGVILTAAGGSTVNKSINERLIPSWKKEEDKTSVFMIGDMDVAELGKVGETVNVLTLFSYGPLLHAMAPQDMELIEHVTGVMAAQMEEYCKQLKENYIPRQGELCLAPYEGLWYRAVCLEPNTTSTAATVNFIDFGNIEEILHTDLRLITKDFYSTKTLASVCQVVGLGPLNEEEELPPAIGARVTELIPSNSVTLVKIIECKKPGEYVVELPEIQEILIKEGLLKL